MPAAAILDITYFNPPTPWGVGPCGIRRFNNNIFISIHPPRGGWDQQLVHPYFAGVHFNPPTPWGVGRCTNIKQGPTARISIHPPRGGWDDILGGEVRNADISIHPPRGGWDEKKTDYTTFWLKISIHPPRGGWDSGRTSTRAKPIYFNPPTPWGVGQSHSAQERAEFLFQSTHPVGGGTQELEAEK